MTEFEKESTEGEKDLLGKIENEKSVPKYRFVQSCRVLIYGGKKNEKVERARGKPTLRCLRKEL